MKREWMERLGFLILAALVWIPAARWEQQRSEPDHTAWEEAVARAREEVAQGAAALQKAQEAAAQRTAPEVVGESASDLPSNDAPKWVRPATWDSAMSGTPQPRKNRGPCICPGFYWTPRTGRQSTG